MADKDYPDFLKQANKLTRFMSPIFVRRDDVGDDCTQLSAGQFSVDSDLTITTGQTLVGMGASTVLVMDKDASITVSGQYATLRDVMLIAKTGDEGLYDGLSVTGSRHTIENISIMQPSKGLLLPEATYSCSIKGIYIYQAALYGIELGSTSTAANNKIEFKQIIGTDAENSYGIYVIAGSNNKFEGGQIDHFDYAIVDNIGHNRYVGIWEELCNYAYKGTARRSYFDACHLNSEVVLEGTADVVTNESGYQLWNDVGRQRPSWSDLSALYFFETGAAQAQINDYSGNTNHGTLSGAANSTVSGAFGDALQIGSGGKVDVPNAVLDIAKSFTIALMWKPITLVSYNNILYSLVDDAEYIQALADDGAGYYKMRFYSGSVTDYSRLSMRQNKWCWLIVTYDGSDMQILDPVTGTQDIAHATPLEEYTDISIHAADAFVAQYQVFAVWQRELTVNEAHQFINGAHWLAWADKIGNNLLGLESIFMLDNAVVGLDDEIVCQTFP